MSIFLKQSIVAAFAAAAILAPVAHAQQPADAVFNRARQMVVNGNGAGGRLLIDSIVSATSTDSPVYGDALYWRAALAATNTDAERDYRRLIVEYPLSSHTADALYALAQLENARGDKASASAHLGQFLADNPKRPDRPAATLMYVKLLLDQNQLPRGCSALRQTIDQIPDSLVETRNQLEFYLPRCVASDVTPGGAVPVNSAAPTRTASRDSSHTKAVPTVGPKARYSLQIAAYKTREEADAVAKRLKQRNLDDVRVVEGGNLFRVRVGRYVTKAGAVAAQRDLKAKKLTAIVTDAEPDGK